jgi:hypothetical protein
VDIEYIKKRISILAKEHNAIDAPGHDELTYAEVYEGEAEDLILRYCDFNDYTINGFPKVPKALFETQSTIEGEDEECYFSRERYGLFLDLLALEKEDVAELLWFYNHSFWPEFFETKEGFLKMVKESVQGRVL